MSERRKTLIFLNLIITSFSSTLLATAMVVALPNVVIDLNVSLATGQWVTSGFALASAVIMPLSAYLINRISTKRLYLGSLILIIIGLLICAVAQNFPVMIAGRVIQAASGGILSAMAQVILLTIYSRDKHGTIMGWYGLAMGFGPVIAPTISGILMDLYSWRIMFVLSIVLMAISFICALLLFDNFLPTSISKFDIYSFTLSAFAFGGLTLGIGNITNYGITNPFASIPLCIGMITLVLFVKRQLLQDTPFLNVRLMKYPVFAFAVISAMLHSFLTQGTAILMPTLMQNVYQCSATETGLFMLVPSVMFALVSPVAGKVYDKFGIRKLYIFSTLLLLFGNGIMVIATEDMPILIVMLLYSVRNVGLALLMMPLVTWGMSIIGKEQYAQGTAVMNTMKNVAGAIGTAVIIGFMSLFAQLNAASVHAEMYGVNAAFALSTVITVFMLVIAMFFVKEK